MVPVPDGHELPVAIAGVNTAILLSSTSRCTGPSEGARNETERALRVGVLTTFLLGGCISLCIQVNEYFHLGFAIGDSAQSPVLYGLKPASAAHTCSSPSRWGPW